MVVVEDSMQQVAEVFKLRVWRRKKTGHGIEFLSDLYIGNTTCWSHWHV